MPLVGLRATCTELVLVCGVCHQTIEPCHQLFLRVIDQATAAHFDEFWHTPLFLTITKVRCLSASRLTKEKNSRQREGTITATAWR